MYVKMFSHTEASALRARMHGRFFATNKIIAELVDEVAYNKKHKLKTF